MRAFKVVLSLIIKCSWCGKVMGGDGNPPISHGICDACAKKHF